MVAASGEVVGPIQEKYGGNDFIDDYVSNLYSVFVNAPGYNEDAIFTLYLASSVIKPKISEFLARGIQALQTENMRDAIIKC